mmetsp:Transcript_31017/g.77707  ORF Transcript_31017/g.77707 Transcript_31017/m.77707 type:complete len:468 (-) Transcript_31017:374-1777(-)
MSTLVEASPAPPAVARGPVEPPMSPSSAGGTRTHMNTNASTTAAEPEASPIIALRCAAQNYAWGRLAEDSEVAGLVAAAGGSVDGERRYAELWMGTHPSGPSTLADSGASLRDWIAANPVVAMGQKVAARFGDDLPFLFKVLSVQTALSIQAHPDKGRAAALHAASPDIYKDPNHKPEMAVALSDDFSALCGFVPAAELVAALADVPEIAQVVGRPAVDAYLAAPPAEAKPALRALYGALMTAAPEAVTTGVAALVARLSATAPAARSDKEALALRLHADYPHDVGVLSVWFLNFVQLPAGHAIYLGPNEPHAYLSGELMEVMATSDNVVRAGCTPKLKDVPVLLEMLTYEQGAPPVLTGDAVRPHTTRYAPPMEEFELEAVRLPAGGVGELPAMPSPAIVLVQKGAATGSARAPGADAPAAPALVARGDVFFLPAGTGVDLTAGEDGATLWVAYVSRRVWAEEGST